MDNYLSIIDYIIPFFAAFILSLIFTYFVRKIAIAKQIVDKADETNERKIHKTNIPLLGGIAIFISVVLVVLIYTLFSDRILGGYVLPKYLWGMLIAGILLMLGGFLDDKYNLKPSKQIMWPILATLTVIGVGIGINYITNPFGGTINFDTIKIELFTIENIPYYFIVLADIFAFLWLMGMMYTTKFLDGLDGLVSGITTIGAFILFFLSLNSDVAQPETALLSIILAGATAGFLIWNFHPAKIFLGEGGSLFMGFMLGVLSIISGAKIATALLIMGIPILDVVWVIIRRVLIDKKSPFSSADKKHLHFRLLDVGLSHRQVVLLLYFISLSFGSVAIFMSGQEKFIALCLMVFVMILFVWFIIKRYRNRKIN
ncbi:MAG: glycosyltransferase family 4 protein [Candidatus Kerfeldbacteria bacterium]